MPGDIDPYGFERLQLTNLADLDRLIADRFSLPPRPYHPVPTALTFVLTLESAVMWVSVIGRTGGAIALAVINCFHERCRHQGADPDLSAKTFH